MAGGPSCITAYYGLEGQVDRIDHSPASNNLKDGSRQEYVWGADWLPFTREIRFEALINIRPRQGNYSLEIQDPSLQKNMEEIVRRLLEVS